MKISKEKMEFLTFIILNRQKWAINKLKKKKVKHFL